MTEATTWTQIPYPSEDDDPWYIGFQAMAATLDAAQYAHREDRHLLISGGGTVAWNSVTGVLSWSAEIQILAAITGRQWTIAAGSVTLSTSVGLIAQTTINRAPTVNTAVVVSAGSTVPGLAGGNNALTLAVRVGDIVYLRTGISIANGNSVTGFAAQLPGPVITPPDLRTAAMIVGNSPAGDTILDCDYLDDGSGIGIQTALIAAGVAGVDVYVRSGTYDFDQVGGPVARLVVPAGVRCVGAGREVTVVRTHTTGDQRAFILADGAVVEDIGVFCPVPMGAQAGGDGIFTFGDDNSEVRRCRVEFSSGWAAIGNPAWIAIQAAFCTAAGVTDVIRCIDCEAIDVPHGVTLGGIAMSPFRSEGGISIIERMKGEDGDYPVYCAAISKIFKSVFTASDDGAMFVAGADESEFDHNRVTIDAAAGTESGVTLSAVNRCSVTDNWLEATTGHAASIAVKLLGSDMNVVRGNCGNGDSTAPVSPGWPFSVDLDATSDSNSILGNVFGGGAVTVDAGAGNDVAHNL